MKDLEHKVREAVAHGQPRTHRPWKKILLVVEGVYRYMYRETSICSESDCRNKLSLTRMDQACGSFTLICQGKQLKLSLMLMIVFKNCLCIKRLL